jgi:phosphotransacetylase
MACRVRVARVEMRSRCTLLAAMLVRQGRADAMLCGTFGATANTCATCAT